MNRRQELARMLREEAVLLEPELTDPPTELLNEVADLLDPPEDDGTIEVRVHVRVDVDLDEWEYHAVGIGSNGQHDPDARRCLDGFSESPAFSIVVARVPKPAPPSVVEGLVGP